jgi:hypothetical protein
MSEKEIAWKKWQEENWQNVPADVQSYKWVRLAFDAGYDKGYEHNGRLDK